MTDYRHISGAVSELYVASYLTEKGYIVSRPFMTQSEYDLVIEFNGKFQSVQVKKATWSKAGNYSYLQARVVSKDKRRYRVNVDLFCFTDNKTVWLVGANKLEDMTSVCLGSTNLKYRQYTKYDATEWII